MIKPEELTDFYYFIKGKIYYSKSNNTRSLFNAEVAFALKDGLFICIKNRYDRNHDSIAFITRKGFIDYVQSLYNAVPPAGYIGTIEAIMAESIYRVNENSPIHLIKNRWE